LTHNSLFFYYSFLDIRVFVKHESLVAFPFSRGRALLYRFPPQPDPLPLEDPAGVGGGMGGATGVPMAIGLKMLAAGQITRQCSVLADVI
jgi:hypothetical protein